MGKHGSKVLQLPHSRRIIHKRGLDIGTVQLFIDIFDVFPKLSNNLTYVFLNSCWIFEMCNAFFLFLGSFFKGINGYSLLRFAILALEVVIIVQCAIQCLMLWFFDLNPLENAMVILGSRTPATWSHDLNIQKGLP